MTIGKLPSGKYRVRQMVNGVNYSVIVDHKPSKKEADELIREVIGDGSNSVIKGTFEDYANKYISIKENVIAPSTIRSYTFMLKNIPVSFKETQITKITSESIQAAINQYATTHAPKTVRNMSGFISAVMQMYRPTFNYSVTLPQKKLTEYYIPTKDEVKQILEFSKGKSYEVMFQLGCYGLRRSEASALTFSDLEEDNTLHINKAMVQDKNGEWVTKTTKTVLSTRDIIISDELAELIRSIPHDSDDELIYKNKPYQIRRALSRCQKELNIPDFRLHDLRHFFVTELSEANIPEEDIMYLGGYSSDYVMKKVYRHARIEKDKEAKKNASSIISKITS